jgi:HAD superfamily hydrolase (TIGR01509 family)
MNALLFGSIGSLVETSEIQRDAFNRAFADHGLSWQWQRSDYQRMLAVSGGRARIESYAQQYGETVDAAAIHNAKSQYFQAMLSAGEANPRAGVVQCIEMAKQRNVKIGLVTSTSAENIDAVLAAVAQRVPRSSFDAIIDIDQCALGKPDPCCYQHALEILRVTKDQSIAIEDNTDGVASARSAGVFCIAYPGINTADHDYSSANLVTDDLYDCVHSRISQNAIAS